MTKKNSFGLVKGLLLIILLTAFSVGSFTQEDHTHFSKVFGREKPYRIFLPKDYNSTQKKYPVVYFFHGNNKKNKRINIKVLKLLANFGDLFVRLGFYNFYMQSRRFNNMTKSFVVNNNKLQKITGKLPWNLDRATKNFVDHYKKNIDK